MELLTEAEINGACRLDNCQIKGHAKTLHHNLRFYSSYLKPKAAIEKMIEEQVSDHRKAAAALEHRVENLD